jgi:hypothetical protein
MLRRVRAGHHLRTPFWRTVGAAACGLVVLGVVVALPARSGGAERRGALTRVVWTGNYESRDFSQWQQVLQEAAGAARIVSKPVAQGRYAARFVLGPQTTATGSRIEAHQPDEGASGGHYGSETWYTWAELVPSGAQFAPHSSFNHLIQWLPDTAECSGAALSVNGLAKPPRLLFRTKGGDIVSFDEGCELADERTFDLGPLPRDRWLRFRLHIKWSADPREGFVELWMNGGRKVKFTRLATAPSDNDHYLRQGIYRFRCTCRTVVYGDAMTVKQVVP